MINLAGSGEMCIRDSNKHDKKIPETGKDLIGNLLTAQAGNADDGPYIGLRDHIHQLIHRCV